ncbi:HD domain-containing protein [Roseivirga sp. UBA838]|uniref:HD domain-containing protein n=1 Tax=Roseivirga sp. UBA838 TaxID=1947393 RepID=UPI00257CB29D|nr:HD domain-containing protein [Roseivirga sp. UBA838]|tara:strand:+ start:82 stop:663 length:582 start_codon:yes stop_codon:yes gene_type:complete
MSSSSTLSKQVQFIHEIDKLKYVERMTCLFNSNRHENDAEHSWHLCMMALILATHSDQPLDMLKVLKMLLIHDIVEIDAGDTFLFDTQKSHDNTEEELRAAHRIFGLLPKDQAEELIEVWKEFEAAETNEAKFAKAIDRLAPMMQNASNKGGTWAQHNVAYETVIAKKQRIKEGSESLWQYAKALVDKHYKKA